MCAVQYQDDPGASPVEIGTLTVELNDLGAPRTEFEEMVKRVTPDIPSMSDDLAMKFREDSFTRYAEPYVNNFVKSFEEDLSNSKYSQCFFKEIHYRDGSIIINLILHLDPVVLASAIGVTTAGVYKFIKDYEQLRSGAIKIKEDIESLVTRKRKNPDPLLLPITRVEFEPNELEIFRGLRNTAAEEAEISEAEYRDLDEYEEILERARQAREKDRLERERLRQEQVSKSDDEPLLS